MVNLFHGPWSMNISEKFPIRKACNLKRNAVGVRLGSTPSNDRNDLNYFPYLFGNKY